jgi:MoxR-like ATPase
MILQEKKVQEFLQILASEKVRILLMSGPPGSGKNSLIDLACKREGLEVLRYKEEQESTSIYDTLGI